MLAKRGTRWRVFCGSWPRILPCLPTLTLGKVHEGILDWKERVGIEEGKSGSVKKRKEGNRKEGWRIEERKEEEKAIEEE